MRFDYRMASFGLLTVFLLPCSLALAQLADWLEEAKLIAPDGSSDDLFGWSVSIDRDTIVAGACGEATFGEGCGAAYVYVCRDGAWLVQAKLMAPDPGWHAQFGRSVAVNADTIVIGAPGADEGRGAAYVFVRQSDEWSYQAKLEADDRMTADQFGSSVSIVGDLVLIGAPFDDSRNGFAAGSAYVFARHESEWSQEAKLTAADGAPNDQFGNWVDTNGAVSIVSARKHDHNGPDSGSAYVFARGEHRWFEQAELTNSDGETGDHFGCALALDGDTVLIGAMFDDDNGGNSGSVYAFRWIGNQWVEQAKLLPDDGITWDEFGVAVAIDGNTALIGAFGDDDLGFIAGAAYVFVREGDVWTQNTKLHASDGAVEDEFGFATALGGDTAVIGVPKNRAMGYWSGAAYVFCTDGPLLDVDPNPLLIDQLASFRVLNTKPRERTYLAYSLRGRGSTYIPILNVMLDLENPLQATYPRATDDRGDLEWTLFVPPDLQGREIWLQAAQFELTTPVVPTRGL